MANITTDDGVRLHVEEAGTGEPILFMHEFGGHHLSWEPQMRHFSRRYRCITYAVRGWPPSDVPDDVAAYSQARAADDAACVLDGLGIRKAHLVGLSQGATAALEFGIRQPGRALSLTVAAGGGGGSTDAEARRKFQAECARLAANLEREGMAAMAELYCAGSARVQYRNKDPRGWAEFKQQFAEGSAKGRARTMVGVQGARTPFFEREAELKAMQTPTLVVVGDEDDGTIGLALFLKRVLPRSGVLMLPKTGHTINLEEPAHFNAFLEEFLDSVTHDRWGELDPVARQKYFLLPPEKG